MRNSQFSAGTAQPDRTSVLLLLGVGTLIALMLPLSRAGMDAGMAPLAYAFWQALGGGIVLLVCRWRHSPLRWDGATARYFGISGLTAIAVPNAVAFVMVANIGSGLTATLYALPSLATYAIAVVLGMESLSGKRASPLWCYQGEPTHCCLVVQSLLTAISYRGFFHLQQRTSPTFLSQLGFVITPVGLLFGIVFFGESYGWAVWGGVVLLLMGVVLANRPSHRSPHIAV